MNTPAAANAASCPWIFRDAFGIPYTCSLPAGHPVGATGHAHDDTAHNGGWVTWREATRGAEKELTRA